MTAPPDRIRRPLGAMERWYWICDQISPLNVIARVRLTGSCPHADLERAAAGLAREHPLLRVAIAADPDGSNPRFVAAGNPRIPIRRVRAGATRWEHEVDDVELRSSLDWRSGPLARIVDVADDGGHDLILTVSHVIADGTTALELVRRLIELAADPSARPAPRAALPPVEAILPKRVNGMPRVAHLIASVLADQVAVARARPHRLWPATTVAPAARRTRLIRRELDAEHLAGLTARCRREGVTVHSALSAAMAIAVAAVETETPRSVCVGAPVDFRAELDPPVDRQDAGAYVATVPSYVRLEPDLWAVARNAHRDLRRRRRSRQHLALVAMLRMMSPRSAGTSARAVGFVERAGPGNVCLSNLGRFPFPGRIGRWRLSGAQFVAGVSISGYLVAAVNTSHGVLHWNFTHIDGAVPGAGAEEIADRAVRTLLSGLRRAGTPVGSGTRG